MAPFLWASTISMSNQLKGLIFVGRYDQDPSKISVSVVPAGATEPTFVQVADNRSEAMDLAGQLAESHGWPIKDLLALPDAPT